MNDTISSSRPLATGLGIDGIRAIVFSWMAYGFYQPVILTKLGFAQIAGSLRVIQGLLGAIDRTWGGGIVRSIAAPRGESVPGDRCGGNFSWIIICRDRVIDLLGAGMLTIGAIVMWSVRPQSTINLQINCYLAVSPRLHQWQNRRSIATKQQIFGVGLISGLVMRGCLKSTFDNPNAP